MATNTESVTSQKTVSIERTFDLPAKKLWQAWTEPESCKKWWGPKDFTCPHCNINFKVGGKYLNCMRSSEGAEFWTTGVYKEIIPGKKLVFTDSFSDKNGKAIPASDLNMPGNWPMELLVTVTFEEIGGKTKMNLQQVGVPQEMYDECIKGWNECFDKLEEKMK